MRVSDFHFDLPEDLIAQHPPAVRGSSRMLVLNRQTGACTDSYFTDLPRHLRAGDLLILNNSRVIPARLYATRPSRSASPADPPARVEVLLTRQLSPDLWTALTRPARKVDVGDKLLFFATPAGPSPLLEAEVILAGAYGERTLRFVPAPDLLAILDCIGHMPLPPYIRRSGNERDSPEDRDRYQTVFAAHPGSAAAPTAGLHFTTAMIDNLRAAGVQVETVMLHVGLGTFQPVRADLLEDIRLHEEIYLIPETTAAAIDAAYRSGRRIIAVGTTSARTLEASVQKHESHPAQTPFTGTLSPQARAGATDIFLSPGHRFRLVSGLLTNFHLPQSTLLMLVSAFAAPDDRGRQTVLAAYAHAIHHRYRFFSYGDCMLLL